MTYFGRAESLTNTQRVPPAGLSAGLTVNCRLRAARTAGAVPVLAPRPNATPEQVGISTARLDVFNHEPFPFDEELRRSTRGEVAPGLLAPVVSLDTLLAMKRAAGRGKDLIDVDELHLAHGLPSSYDCPQP